MSTTEKKYHSSEWFMPCLLMRLTDQNPQDKRETISQIVDLQQLKQDILQNISMLMNSRSHIVDQNLLHDPYLGTSVLAYGLSDHCGCNYEQATLTAIEEEITR